MLLHASTIDPIDGLFGGAVINGVVAVPKMVLMMLLSNNKTVMGDFCIPSSWAGVRRGHGRRGNRAVRYPRR